MSPMAVAEIPPLPSDSKIRRTRCELTDMLTRMFDVLCCESDGDGVAYRRFGGRSSVSDVGSLGANEEYQVR
jgi:hypothetical protein